MPSAGRASSRSPTCRPGRCDQRGRCSLGQLGLLIPRQLVRQQHRDVESLEIGPADGVTEVRRQPLVERRQQSSVGRGRATPASGWRDREEGDPRPQALRRAPCRAGRGASRGCGRAAPRPSPGPRSGVRVTSATVMLPRRVSVRWTRSLRCLSHTMRVAPIDLVGRARLPARPRRGRRRGGCGRWCGCRRGRRRRRTARGPVGRPCRPTRRRRCAAGTGRPGCAASPTRSG